MLTVNAPPCPNPPCLKHTESLPMPGSAARTNTHMDKTIMLIRGKILALILVVPILFACKTTSGQNISADQLKFFESKIRPVLVRECYSCHSDQAGQRKGGLRVDTKARLEVGGDSGPAIVPGDAAESLLLSAINHEDYVMPPRKKLSDREIADFRSWIEMGAPDPRKTKTTKAQSTVSNEDIKNCLLYTSPSPRDLSTSRMPSSA